MAASALAYENESDEFIRRPTSLSEIDALLDGHGIERGSVHHVRPFPLRQGEETFTTRFDATLVEDDRREFTLFLVSDLRGEKRVATITAWDPYRQRFLNRSVAGYILSPFESRIAIAVSGVDAGFEGEPECWVTFVGAHLSVGFSSPS